MLSGEMEATVTSDELARDGRLERGLNGAVAVFALWTLVYHVALLAKLKRDVAAAVFVVAGVALIAVAIRRQSKRQALVSTDPENRQRTVIIAAIVAAGTLAALLFVASHATLFAAAGAVTVASAIVFVPGSRGLAAKVERAAPSAREVIVVALLALAAASFVAIARSPNADDTYYLNRAMYMRVHDTRFPLKDTMFGDQKLPNLILPDVLASYEPLVGTIAAHVHVDARTLYYLWFGSIAAAFAVIAIWQLARTAGARSAVLVTAVALVMLGFQAADAAGWPRVGLYRIYQGKAMLVVALSPWLWHHALTYARTASRRSLTWLAIGGVAAVGLSSSGTLVDAIIVAGAVLPIALLRRDEPMSQRIKKVLVGSSAAAYPVILALAGLRLLASAQAALTDVPPSTLSQWMDVMGRHYMLLLTSVALLAGWALIRSSHASLGFALAGLAAVVFLSPVGLVVLKTTNIGYVAWRIVWAVPVPIIVGLAVDAPLWSQHRRSVRIIASAVMGSVVLAISVSQLRELPTPTQMAQHRNLHRPVFGLPSWDLQPEALRAAERLVRIAPHGEVAAPEDVSSLVPDVTTSSFAVTPRVLFTKQIAPLAGPSFRPALRTALTASLDTPVAGRLTVLNALDVFGVKAVCVRPDNVDVEDWLMADHFTEVGSADDECSYWRR